MPQRQTGTIHYHTQLRLPEKGRTIKGLVIWSSWYNSLSYIVKTFITRWHNQRIGCLQ